MKLTNDTVRTLPVKGSDTLYADSETPGLYLRVRAGGSRTFIIQWRQGQFQRRSTIGKVSGILSVDEARRKARKLISDIDDGHDPIAAKAKSRVDDKQLFGVLADEYLPIRAKDMKAAQSQAGDLSFAEGLEAAPQAAAEEDRPGDGSRRAAEHRQGEGAGCRRSRPAARCQSSSAGACWRGDRRGQPGGWHQQDQQGVQPRPGPDRRRACGDLERGASLGLRPHRQAAAADRPATQRDRGPALGWKSRARRYRRANRQSMLPKERAKNGRGAYRAVIKPQALAVLGECTERVGRASMSSAKGRAASPASPRPRNGWTRPAASPAGRCTICDAPRWPPAWPISAVQPHIIEAILNHVSGHKSGVAGVYNRSSYAAVKALYAALILWGNHIRILLAKAAGANDHPKLRA